MHVLRKKKCNCTLIFAMLHQAYACTMHHTLYISLHLHSCCLNRADAYRIAGGSDSAGVRAHRGRAPTRAGEPGTQRSASLRIA